MTEQDLKDRTKQLAHGVIDYVEGLPKTRVGDVLGKQLLRSGTSVGANYRAACRSRSAAEMIAKLGTVEEEADESQFWLELLSERKYGDLQEALALIDEFDQIIAIVVASRKTLRNRTRR